MKYLFFDTETTGLPKSWYRPLEDLDNWPRLVQLAWVLCDDNGDVVNEGNRIIKPEGFSIPIEASNIHKITTQRAEEEGIPLQQALEEFRELLEESDCLVAHNISFDEKIVEAEFLRQGIEGLLVSKRKICTKEVATDFCAIENVYGYSGYKWPKLSELHQKLFGVDFADSHNAAVDVSITAKCFWEMKKLKIL